MTVHWIACRDLTLDEPADPAEPGDDLGSLAHVRKVLEATFRGLAWTEGVGSWADGKVSIRIHLPDQSRPSRIDVAIEADSGVSPESHLGGRFRTLATKRFWAVFDAATQERVQLGPPKARRYGPLPPPHLVPCSPQEIRHSSEEWLVYYVEWRPGDYWTDVLDCVTGAAESLSNGADFGVVSEPVLLRLASGEQLCGLGFMSKHGFVVQVLPSLPQTHGRTVATFEDDSLKIFRADSVERSVDFSCFQARTSRDPDLSGAG